MCLYPRLIKNAKYTPTKKNGGEYTPPHEVVDKRVLMVPIGCGQCKECRDKKSREWRIRLQHEIKKPTDKKALFITLTLSNEEYTKLYNEDKIHEYTKLDKKTGEVKTGTYKGYDKDNNIAKKAVRRWLERNRKKEGVSIRHWLVTELGQNNTENIHLHGIIWTNQTKEEIENTWQYGMVWIGEYVSERTVNYIIKYTTKIDKKHKTYKAKVLTSAGIGSGYEETINGKTNRYKPNGETKTYLRTNSGHKIAIPTYWRNKIYSEEEREQLWIEMLNEETRYINGIKINISKNEKLYHDLLKQAQRESENDGYGTGDFEWKEKQYEEQRRELLQKQRLRSPTGAKATATL